MVKLVIEQRRRNLGGGIEVGRVLPFSQRQMVGPYIFFDHIGPMNIPAGVDRTADVRPHPHIGLSTVTYLFSGELMHRDSLGYEQAIRPKEVNWMTAGRGITHSERLEHARAHGDHLHGIQAWVALPTELEEVAPGFSHHASADLPQWSDGGVHGIVLAGSAYGLTSGVAVHSPQFYVHLDMEAGATAEIPAGHRERAVYIATGTIVLRGVNYGAGKMLVLDEQSAWIRALTRSSVMLLGGEPIGERYVYWNFVSSSKARLRQAAADWQAGRMKLPDGDDAEFTPLPDDHTQPAPAVRGAPS